MKTRAISFRHRLWLGLALVHLTFVTIGAASVELAPRGTMGKIYDFYCQASGAGNSYGFFAPGIFNQLRVTFDLFDSQGKAHKADLATGASHEADLRTGNIIDQFADHENLEEMSEELQRSLSASLARVMFMRYPSTKQVTVHLDNYSPVSREEFIRGKRPSWTEVYEARYSRMLQANSK